MSAHKPQPVAPTKPKSFGWMAEYGDEHSLLVAARKVRDSGYTRTDAYTPFPVHGIDEALGIKPTILPFIVLGMGLLGMFGAMTMQVWMNGIDYRYIISGKPFLSIPAFIPVTFETTVLFSAFTTFFAMWALNGLPRFSNPIFTSPKFDRVTDDRFFLHVDARDRYFNRESVRELLAGTNPLSLEEVVEDSTPDRLPLSIWMGVTTLAVAALIPLSIVLNMRASTDDKPRWHVFYDMDFQPKKKAQQTTTIFADGRIARLPVVGTIARGQLTEEDAYYLGYDPTKQASAVDHANSIRLVSAQEEGKPPTLAGAIEDAPAAQSDEPKAKKADEAPKKKEKAGKAKKKAAAPADSGEKKTAKDEPTAAKSEESGKSKSVDTPPAQPPEADKKPDGATPEPPPAKPTTPPSPPPAAAVVPPTSGAAPAAGGPNLPWITEFPTPVTAEMLKLGRTKFETYCSACHGFGGDGDGLVHRRADQLQQGDWIPPTSLHDARVRSQPVGNLFYTITHGKGKMANYAAVLNPQERWAVVMYVKALQRSRHADIQDVPVDERSKIDVKKAD